MRAVWSGRRTAILLALHPLSIVALGSRNRGNLHSANASTIVRLTTLDPTTLHALLTASQREGFRFLERLCEEWENGCNRFDKPGEALFGLSLGAELLAIGGINRQDKSTGRLRRFYVLPSHRRRGLGSRLLRHILTHAAGHFRRVILRTTTDAANRFYLAQGFKRAQDSCDATHGMELPCAEFSGRRKRRQQASSSTRTRSRA